MTLRDVAQASGVSITTVSRILNGRESGVPIRDDTRERVVRTAAELGYRPNLLARGLRGQASTLLGVIARDIADPFHIQILQGINAASVQRGYRMFLGNVDYHAEEALAFGSMFERSHADGIILIGDIQGGESAADEIARQHGHVVGVTDRTGPRAFPGVYTDSEAGTLLALQHLWDLGHRAIMCVSDARTADGRSRIDVYERFMREHDLADRIDVQVTDQETALAFDLGSRLFARPLDAIETTAIYATSDTTAIGLMQAAFRAGIAIPDRLSIVGFDDIDVAAFIDPAAHDGQPGRGADGTRGRRAAVRHDRRQQTGDPRRGRRHPAEPRRAPLDRIGDRARLRDASMALQGTVVGRPVTTVMDGAGQHEYAAVPNRGGPMFDQPADAAAHGQSPAPAGMRELTPRPPGRPVGASMPAIATNAVYPGYETPLAGVGLVPEVSADRPGPDDSVVARDDHLEGTFTSRGTIHVMGSVKGRIEAQRLHIADGARVEAEVVVDEAVIAGEFIGNLTCRQRLEARPSGRLSGILETYRVMLHEGASVEGEVRMLPEPGRAGVDTIRGSAHVRGAQARARRCRRGRGDGRGQPTDPGRSGHAGHRGGRDAPPRSPMSRRGRRRDRRPAPLRRAHPGRRSRSRPNGSSPVGNGTLTGV